MIDRAVGLYCTALGYGLQSVLWIVDHVDREPQQRQRIGASITVLRAPRRTRVRRAA